MGVIQNFNRSINITIKNSAGIIIEQIRTPQYGKKPNIEINGALYINDIAGVFDIKLKNYYLKTPPSNTRKLKSRPDILERSRQRWKAQSFMFLMRHQDRKELQ